MRRHVWTGLLAAALAAAAAPGRAQDARPESAPRAAAEPIAIGAALPPEVRAARVRGEGDVAEGEPESLAEQAGGRPLVVLFWSGRCPVSRRYNPLVRGLAKDFAERVRFVVVCPNARDEENLLGALRGAGIDLPLFTDRRQEAANRLGVVVTPTALLFDAGGALRYRGPVDDDRRAKNRDTTEHLRLALEAVLAGRTIDSPEPRPFGSSVRRAQPQ